MSCKAQKSQTAINPIQYAYFTAMESHKDGKVKTVTVKEVEQERMPFSSDADGDTRWVSLSTSLMTHNHHLSWYMRPSHIIPYTKLSHSSHQLTHNNTVHQILVAHTLPQIYVKARCDTGVSNQFWSSLKLVRCIHTESASAQTDLDQTHLTVRIDTGIALCEVKNMVEIWTVTETNVLLTILLHWEFIQQLIPWKIMQITYKLVPILVV